MILHADELGPSVLLGNILRLRKLPGPHRRSTDVTSLARLHHIMECFHGFFNWRGGVKAMNLIQVDVVHAQAAQAVVDLGHYCFAREACGIAPFAHGAVNFGGYDNFIAKCVVTQCSPHKLFTGSQ